VKGAFERDQPEAFRRACCIMETPRHLDGAFDGFSARIRKKHRVGETRFDQPSRQTLCPGTRYRLEVCQSLPACSRKRCHQIGMRMTKSRDSYARTKVEIALALFVKKVRALATFKCDIRPVVGRKYRRNQRTLLCVSREAKRAL
jgi:hypothetical protein